MSASGRFIRDSGGNFAVIAALMMVPLVFAMGSAIDIARGLSARTDLQDALDAAALTVVRDSGFDQAKAEEVAEAMVLANYGSAYSGLKVILNGQAATVSARTEVATSLTRILGFADVNASVESHAELPPTRYEIALVLDTTGSMEGQKLAQMKAAAAKMVDELTDSEVLRSQVSFALVPFSTYVNVGPDHADASWLDGEGALQVPGSMIPAGVSRLKLFENFDMAWPGCVEARVEQGVEEFSVDDTAPTKSNPRTLFVPVFSPDEPSTKSWGYNLYPNDYVADSSLKGLGVTFKKGVPVYKPVKKTVKPYRFYSNVATPQGPGWGCDSRPITPLTKNYVKVKSEIALLEAAGSTNITDGVAWGARVLSPGEPFTEGRAPGEDVEKIIVLLTDGDNSITVLSNTNKSDYSSYGYVVDGRWDGSYKTDPNAGKVCRFGELEKDLNCSVDDGGFASGKIPSVTAVTAAMDVQTSRACELAKAAGHEIFTIRLEVDSASSSALLQNCATDPSHYYDAPDAKQLQEVFDEIANRIKKTRITS